MATVSDEFMLRLLRAMADRAPEPLYPARYAGEQSVSRDQIDAGLDELRRRGLARLTDWVKDFGQGCALTDAGKTALAAGDVSAVPAPAPPIDDVRDGPELSEARTEIVRRVFVRPGLGLASRILLGLNVGYFIVGALLAWNQNWSINEYLAGEEESINLVLIDLGGLHPALVFPSDGRMEPERLLLYSFLHVGLFHLLMNMFFVATLARSIEAMWGAGRFVAIYLIAGFIGGCAVLLIGLWQREAALTAGASGSIYGIFVSMVAWFYLNQDYLAENVLQEMSRILMPNVILLVVINFVPGISWQGHLGGAVGGLVVAVLLHVQRFHPSLAMRLLALAGVVLTPVAALAAVLWNYGQF